jgi:hypothetical protein
MPFGKPKSKARRLSRVKGKNKAKYTYIRKTPPRPAVAAVHAANSDDAALRGLVTHLTNQLAESKRQLAQSQKKANRDRMKCSRNHLPIALPVGKIKRLMAAPPTPETRKQLSTEFTKAVTKIGSFFAQEQHRTVHILLEWTRTLNNLPPGDLAHLCHTDCAECRSQRDESSVKKDTDEEMARLFALREVMDERKISEVDAHAIFHTVAAMGGSQALKSINATTLRRLRRALDSAIRQKITITKTDYGTVCDVRELTRAMIDYNNLGAGEYDNNVLADGRSFGSARTTTFVASRLVAQDGQLLENTNSRMAIWPLAILRCKETYELLKAGTRDLRRDLKTLQTGGIEVAPVTEEGPPPADAPLVHAAITLWLSGDMKLLLLVTGLNAASSDHACLYCPCGRLGRRDPTREWKIDRELGNLECPGQIRVNLFDFIPLARIVLDVLHLFMRIADRLMRNTLSHAIASVAPPAIQAADRSEQAQWLTDTIGASWGKLCKTQLTIREDKQNSDGFAWSRLNGTKQREIITSFEHREVFEGRPLLACALDQSWSMFWSLYTQINRREITAEMDQWFDSAQQWLMCATFKTVVSMSAGDLDRYRVSVDTQELATQTYGDNPRWVWVLDNPVFEAAFLTPYVHQFVWHVHEILPTLPGKSVFVFSCQSLELQNNLHGQSWFRANCKRPDIEDATIILGQLRLFYNVNAAKTRYGKDKVLWPCPEEGCTQKPYSGIKWLTKHLENVHSVAGDVSYTQWNRSSHLGTNATKVPATVPVLQAQAAARYRILTEQARLQAKARRRHTSDRHDDKRQAKRAATARALTPGSAAALDHLNRSLLAGQV